MGSREEVHVQNVHIELVRIVVSTTVRVGIRVVVNIVCIDESIIRVCVEMLAKQTDFKWLFLRDLSQQDDEEAKC